ncbi:MAG: hypothetical protein FWB71_02145 [Defluviitaleaceae bacterium]|nr:hypothetical protein [Defluviitaleaceae bacterium]
MDIGTMFALGMFGGDDENDDEVSSKMTDLQFKALMEITLKIAESTHEVKAFRKHLSGSWSGVDLTAAAVLYMLHTMADATDDMNAVRSTIAKILTIKE